MISPLFAMHMANELLSVPVAAITLCIAIAAVALATRAVHGRRQVTPGYR